MVWELLPLDSGGMSLGIGRNVPWHPEAGIVGWIVGLWFDGTMTVYIAKA